MAWYVPPAKRHDQVIFNYGDSQGEVLDYVFHGCDEYVTYSEDCRVGWRSGWSTRGLSKAEHVERHLAPLSELDGTTKHAFVFLSYGSVDIEWNLSYKRDVLKQNPDTEKFVDEMIAELSVSVDRLIARGHELRALPCGGPELHVILCFPFVPLPLSDGYLEEFDRKYGGGSYQVIAHSERVALWERFCREAARRIVASHPSVNVVDVRDDFAEHGFGAYTHEHEEDHHPDLAKTQHAVAARVEALRFATADGSTATLKPRLWPHKAMYPHSRRRFAAAATATAPAAKVVAEPKPQLTIKVEEDSDPSLQRSISSDSILEPPDSQPHQRSTKRAGADEKARSVRRPLSAIASPSQATAGCGLACPWSTERAQEQH